MSLLGWPIQLRRSGKGPEMTHDFCLMCMNSEWVRSVVYAITISVPISTPPLSLSFIHSMFTSVLALTHLSILLVFISDWFSASMSSMKRQTICYKHLSTEWESDGSAWVAHSTESFWKRPWNDQRILTDIFIHTTYQIGFDARSF